MAARSSGRPGPPRSDPRQFRRLQRRRTCAAGRRAAGGVCAAEAGRTRRRADPPGRIRRTRPRRRGTVSAATPWPDTTAWSAVIAVHTLWLAARAEGIGLGWVSILDPGTVAATLEVPTTWTFIGYFCIGLPDIEDEVPELERCGWAQRGTQVVLRR